MNNKKSTIFVTVLFLVLMIVPIVALLVVRSNSDSSDNRSSDRGPVVDFELQQLADEAEQLVKVDLLKALQNKDISIDLMSEMRQTLKKGKVALEKGKFKNARKHFKHIIATTENELGVLKHAQAARELNESTYAELERLKHLKTAFANAYSSAVENYNQGLNNLESGLFEPSIRNFEAAAVVLKDLKERSVQEVKVKLEAGDTALTKLDPVSAQSAFERVLAIDSSNPEAKKGLLKVAAIEDVAAEIKSIRSLQESGDNEEALVRINTLLKENPNNLFLADEQKAIETTVFESRRKVIIERADIAEAKGDLPVAIAALKEAIEIRSSKDVSERLAKLEAREKAKFLEISLETGYNALKAGNFEAAKIAYEEALALNPNSTEAHTGLEKASSLSLANIRYNQNIATAEKYLDEGRIPLATKFFNEALTSRPSTVTMRQRNEETRIRKELAENSQKVTVRIVSNNKTYVSLIGVLPPERFKEKELSLYPDVYTIKGSRSSYAPVEVEIKVNKNMTSKTIEVICDERQ